MGRGPLMALGLCTILLSVALVSGCTGTTNDKWDVTVNVLYVTPVHVNDTNVYMDGDLLVQYRDMEVDTFPPIVGQKKTILKEGEHVVYVTDTNYNLTEGITFKLYRTTYIDIIISNSTIDVDVKGKPTGFK
jgi:hypothetical protein